MIKYIQQKKIDYNLLEFFLKDTHDSNQFTNMGPAKRKLEQELESILNIDNDKCVVCVSNGTLALHAIYLYYMNKNIKWVSPSFTFPSCVVGGFDCDIVDIDNTYTMSLSSENIEKYDGFIITNLFGTYPNNIMEWVSICKSKNKILVFDNASSALSTINGVNICNLGDFSFGSLHHTKSLGFGEGGFIVCKKDLYLKINRILGFGFEMIKGKRVFKEESSNFKMSDVASASILQHIKRYNIKKHIEIQNKFVERIKNIKGVRLFNYNEEVVYGNLPLLFSNKIEKDVFLENKIEAHKYYKPIKELDKSMDLYSKIINLPLHIQLTDSDIDFIIKNIIKISKRNIK